MNPEQLTIVSQAVQIKLNRGQKLEEILDGYLGLTDEQREELKKKHAPQATSKKSSKQINK